jgi:hypothetical protein
MLVSRPYFLTPCLQHYHLLILKGKGKVLPTLFLTEHHAMKAYWGNGRIASRILDLGTRWEWSASRPSRFTPREKAPGIYWIGSWVGPRAGLDAVVKRKIPSPCRDSNPRLNFYFLFLTSRSFTTYVGCSLGMEYRPTLRMYTTFMALRNKCSFFRIPLQKHVCLSVCLSVWLTDWLTLTRIQMLKL